MPMRIVVDGKTIVEYGECDGKWRKLEGGEVERFIVVEFSRVHKPRIIDYLPPELHFHVVRSYSLEDWKLGVFQSIVEEGLAARSRGGQVSANQVMRRRLVEYFETLYKRPFEVPDRLMGNVVECTSIRSCAEDIARVLYTMTSILGDAGVVLAAQNVEMADPVLAAYRKMAGRNHHFTGNEYRSLMKSLRRRGWLALMDRGYVVLLLKEGRRTGEIVEAVKRYPYISVFISRT